ncbi:hypothetical protein D3C71_1426560 [compost metagenome]
MKPVAVLLLTSASTRFCTAVMVACAVAGATLPCAGTTLALAALVTLPVSRSAWVI